MSAPAMQSLTRNRDFRIIWVTQAFSELGSEISLFAMPLIALSTGSTATEAGAIVMAFGVASTASWVVSGALADRWNRKRLIVVSDLLLGATYLGLVVSYLAGVLTLMALLAASATTGVLSSLHAPAIQAALPRVVGETNLAQAVSFEQARSQAASLAGPSVGGIALGISPLVPFAIDALSYLGSALGLSRLRTPLQVVESRPSRFLSSIRSGFHFLLGHGLLRSLLIAASAMNALYGALMLSILVALHNAGIPAAAIGAVSSIGAASALMSALLYGAGSRSLSTRTTIVTASAFTVVGAALIASAPSGVAMVAFGLALLMFGGPPIAANIASLRAIVTPDEFRGRTYASSQLISGLIAPLGSLGAGAAADALGAQWTLTVVAAGFGAVLLLLLLNLRTAPRG